jgi:GH15 family glucan-1,4-alpha-glucosidase
MAYRSCAELRNALRVHTFSSVMCWVACDRLAKTALACRNQHGLLAEHIDPRTRALWGNFPQTYSMAGLINAGMRLSIPWDQAF